MKKRLINLGIGLVAGLVAGKVLKTKTVRDMTVGAIAGGLKAKEEIDKKVEELREGTNDLIADAKVKKAKDEEKAKEEKLKEEAAKNIEAIAEEAEKEEDAE